MRPNLKKRGVTPIFSLFLEVVLPSSVVQKFCLLSCL